MSALTFDTLSAELTQALSTQPHLPHAPTVRCTLGRDKVMVLVEYALDSAQAEPASTQTLDWLEQALRDQFDTTGLPEEAVDLAGVSDTLSVQIFLKHISEPKPFTMRAFVWKVDDGFDDLFGEPFADAGVASMRSPQPEQQSERQPERLAEQLAAVAVGSDGDTSYGRPVTSVSRGLQSIDPPETAQRELPAAYFQEEELVPAELDDNHLQLDLEPDATFDPLPDPLLAAPDGSFAAELEAHRFDSDVAEDSILLADSELSETALEEPSLEEITLEETIAELEVEAIAESAEEHDFAPDVGVDAVLTVGDFGLADELDLYSETSVDEALDEELAVGLPETDVPVASAADFDLPGEPPNLESSDEFNLPTLDLPGANVPEINSVDADFFNLDDAGSSFESADGFSVNSPQPFGMDLAAVLESSQDLSQGDLDPGTVEASEIDVLEYELLDGGSSPDSNADPAPALASDLDGSFDGLSADDEDYLTLDDALGAIDRKQKASLDFGDADFTADGQGGDGVGIGNQAEDFLAAEGLAFESEDYGSEDYGLTDYESEASESEGYDSDDEYEVDTDSVYYLEGETSEDMPSDDVAWVDEEEVQRQREQWQQQSKSGNPWVFVGLLGFLVLGLLGFVFTRPCTFGQCDRLQTAQLNNATAFGNLRADSSAKGVTATKQELKRSIDLLAPIPVWSSYYDEAQAVLPGYRGQVSALDYVSAAQDKAYSAAVKSQDPPHTVSTWQEIAAEWLEASELLEKVPADNPVREVADKKLAEYRTNRATILVRIEAESKAEVGLRQAQQAAGLATKQSETADSLEDWEAALSSWESAVDNLSQIPQGTNAHAEAQQLLPEYMKTLDEVRDRTEQERVASRALFQAKQFATDAQRSESEEQWSLSLQHWKSAQSKLQGILPGTLAHAEAQAIKGPYADAIKKSENNLQVALRFRPIEPSFFSACGATSAQKCTYSVRSGNVRLNLSDGYDDAIDQSITPPDERASEASFAQVSAQSAELMQKIATLSTQAQVPVELYDAEGEFMAMYRPDLKGFTR